MKKIHYLSKLMTILKNSGVAACGMYVSTKKYGDNVTTNRQDVTCGNCKRTRVFNEPGNQNSRNQQRCSRCGRVIGCNMNGRKHKCNCASYTRGTRLNVKTGRLEFDL